MNVRKGLPALGLACVAACVAANQGYIQNVPDIVLPPAQPAWAPVGWNGNNFCAPTAAADIIQYWNNNGYAGLSGGFANKGLAGELGWFMDTNDQTVADDGHSGTYINDPLLSGFDVMNGIVNWGHWDAAHFMFGQVKIPHPGGGAPAGKVAYDWSTTLINQQANAMSDVIAEIDAGRPLLTSFTNWDVLQSFNPDGSARTVKLTGGQVVDVYVFNPNPAGAKHGWDESGNYWDQDFGLGHMVATVGYYQNYQWTPAVSGDLLIVHDTIPGPGGAGFITPTDVAIDFGANVQANIWKADINVSPVPEPGSLLALGVGVLPFLRRIRKKRR